MNKAFIVPGLSALGVIAGLAVGTGLSGVVANAATSASSPSTVATSTSSSNSQAPQGPHQYNGKTETALTGDSLSKATSAAKTKYPNATVVRAETDVDGDGTYEIHMQNSDGSQVTVFLDSNYVVTTTASGMSNKNPAPTGNTNRSSSTQSN